MWLWFQDQVFLHHQPLKRAGLRSWNFLPKFIRVAPRSVNQEIVQIFIFIALNNQLFPAKPQYHWINKPLARSS
jgi:hypothetical protein